MKYNFIAIMQLNNIIPILQNTNHYYFFKEKMRNKKYKEYRECKEYKEDKERKIEKNGGRK